MKLTRTLSQNGALYFAHSDTAQRRAALFRRSIHNWTTRSFPKFGARCTIRRAPRLVVLACPLPAKIAQAKTRIRKILFEAMVFIKTFRAKTSDRVGLILLGRRRPAADPPK